MSLPKDRIALSEIGWLEALDALDRAVAGVRTAAGPLLTRWQPTDRASGTGSALAPGGLVLLTDEGRGVGRAVAADLKALGHPVIRVRHGVGEGEVEGVNLTSAAAVAALVERARNRGMLAAIVHVSPLREANGHATAWEGPDDARTLALLAQAGGEDLRVSAGKGGSCLIVARPESTCAEREPDRLARWVEISSRTLESVRVRGLAMRTEAEPEVVAAEIVHAILGADEPRASSSSAPTESRAILLGTPDRAAWIHLAAALVDWLDDSPCVRLHDLAYTLHQDQPPFAFRVGLVARTAADLASRLRRVISDLSDPDCTSILDPAGVYWFAESDRTLRPSRRSRQPSPAWDRRLKIITRESVSSIRRDGTGVREVLERTGRDWFNHIAAERFARGDVIRAERLRFGVPARLLDLSMPLSEQPASLELDSELIPETESLVLRTLDGLDSAIALRRELVLALAVGDGGARR